MILMGPFLLFLFFFFSLLPPFWGQNSVGGPALQAWICVCHWRLNLPLGHKAGGDSSSTCMGQCAMARRHSCPCKAGVKQEPTSSPRCKTPILNLPLQDLQFAIFFRKTYFSFDLELYTKVVPGPWYLSNASVLHITLVLVWLGKNSIAKEGKSVGRTICASLLSRKMETVYPLWLQTKAGWPLPGLRGQEVISIQD